jgi:hypothetical protein
MNEDTQCPRRAGQSSRLSVELRAEIDRAQRSFAESWRLLRAADQAIARSRTLVETFGWSDGCNSPDEAALRQMVNEISILRTVRRTAATAERGA